MFCSTQLHLSKLQKWIQPCDRTDKTVVTYGYHVKSLWKDINLLSISDWERKRYVDGEWVMTGLWQALRVRLGFPPPPAIMKPTSTRQEVRVLYLHASTSLSVLCSGLLCVSECLCVCVCSRRTCGFRRKGREQERAGTTREREEEEEEQEHIACCCPSVCI